MDCQTNSESGRRKLMRHPSDKYLGGVCGGIADFTGVARKTIRIVALILAVVPSGGIGIPLYVLLWLFLPVGTQEAGELAPPIIRSSRYRANHPDQNRRQDKAQDA